MNRRYSFWKDNPSFALTIVYLYVSLVGGLHAFTFYRSFSVNFTRFASAGDYATAAFGDAWRFLLGIAAMAASYVFVHFWNRFSAWIFGPSPKGPRRFSAEVLAVVILLWLPYYAWDQGETKAKQMRALSPIVDARLAGSDKPVKVTVLGNVGPFTFLYEPSADRVIVTPSSGLISMEFSGTVK